MRKLKRPRIIKEFIEKRIEKNQRRITKIADETYKLRLQLQAINALPVQKPLTKADTVDQTIETANAVDAATVEAMKDSADQEIGNSL